MDLLRYFTENHVMAACLMPPSTHIKVLFHHRPSYSVRTRVQAQSVTTVRQKNGMVKTEREED